MLIYNQRMLMFLTSVIVVSALAIPGSPHCGCGPSLEKNAGLIHKAAMMGPIERRTPVANRPDRAKFAGTGEMTCYNSTRTPIPSTIQLTGRNGLVTGAGHAFEPECEPLSKDEIKGCEIWFPLTGDETIYRVKPGSWKLGPRCQTGYVKDDWAVFELDEMVKGIKDENIYGLPGRPIDGNAGHEKPIEVVQLAALGDNLKRPFPQKRKKLSDWYNHDKCNIRRPHYRLKGVSFISDCYAGGGTSGAGQYEVKNGKYILRAICVAGTDEREIPFDEAEDEPNLQKRRLRYHYNYSTAVEGDFLDEIYKRMNGFINISHY